MIKPYVDDIRYRTKVEVKCKECGIMFSVPRHDEHKRQFCGTVCRIKHLHDGRVKYRVDDNFTERDGYLYKRGTGNKKYHRYLMEKTIGRKLLSTEAVHHIDMDKSNNNLSNLIVVLKPEHHQLHGNLEQLASSLIKRGIITFDRNTESYVIKED
jgi:hypothetical protein